MEITLPPSETRTPRSTHTPSDTNHKIANYFIQAIGLQKLVGAPATFNQWSTPQKILQFTGDLQPKSKTLDLTWNDYQSLVHFEIGSRHSFPPPTTYKIIWKYPDLSITEAKRRVLAIASKRLVGLAKVALWPAMDHLTQCKDCAECSVATRLSILKHGLKASTPPPETVAQSLEVMSSIQSRLWGPEQRFDFIEIIRSANLVISRLPEKERYRLSDCLLSLTLIHPKPPPRSFKKHDAHLPKILGKCGIATVVHVESSRINLHVQRRFRSLYLLMIAVSGDRHEYRFRGATLQDVNGTTEEPACHSLLGDVDRREPGMGWRFAEHGEIFQRLPFFKALTCTVILSVDYNHFDSRMENALRPIASELLTDIAKSKMTIHDGFLAFCGAFEEWAKGEDDSDYLKRHLEEIDLFRKNEKYILEFSAADSFYKDYIAPALEDEKESVWTAIQDRLLKRS